MKNHSAHTIGGWESQYKRMHRWNERFERIHESEVQDQIRFDEHIDMLIACLQNIFFFKDWLLHDTEIHKGELHDLINSHESMRICRDVCNGSKHLQVNPKQASIDPNFQLVRAHNPLATIMGGPKYEIVVLVNGWIHVVNKVIADCLALWDHFILNQGLTLPKLS